MRVAAKLRQIPHFLVWGGTVERKPLIPMLSTWHAFHLPQLDVHASNSLEQHVGRIGQVKGEEGLNDQGRNSVWRGGNEFQARLEGSAAVGSLTNTGQIGVHSTLLSSDDKILDWTARRVTRTASYCRIPLSESRCYYWRISPTHASCARIF